MEWGRNSNRGVRRFVFEEDQQGVDFSKRFLQDLFPTLYSTAPRFQYLQVGLVLVANIATHFLTFLIINGYKHLSRQ